MTVALESVIKPFKPFFEKKRLVEICFNKPQEVFLEFDNGEWKHEKCKEITEHVLDDFISNLAAYHGQDFNAKTPIFSGHIPGYGYRAQAIKGSAIEGGFALTVRVGKTTLYPIENYMSKEDTEKLITMMQQGKTILVCGATGSGKTTFLNSLISYIPENLRIITVEDSRELIIPHKNHQAILKSKNSTDVAQITYSQIINHIMRSRPDRILMGEIDTENTFPFLNLANSGHSGCLATIHADSAAQALNKLCSNAALNGAQGAKREDITHYASEAIDAFVTVRREKTAKGRKFSASIELFN
ncbi:Flp pilus assembly complex ATPase component TadA [Vibrio cholerae]|nr:Flp pilus assembly complex ATPase component TadA [Vibrio cholerae]EKF9843112.1 Flp pilus assembly complex ATPase component TadA [Vibrio cholerae]